MADFLDRTQDSDDNAEVYVEVEGRYVEVSLVQVEGHEIVIKLSDDDL